MKDGGKLLLALIAAGAVAAGCEALPPAQPAEEPAAEVADAPASDTEAARAPEVAPALVRNFDRVRRGLGPTAGRICAQEGDAASCSFRFRLDPRADLPEGALVTRGDDGTAVIIATGTLLEKVQSNDELAFVLAHMAGHHIEGHRRGGNQTAIAQTLLSGAQGAASGNIQSIVNTAIRLNSAAGPRSFSLSEEIAADALATRIAAEAGFDPVAGAAFFARNPEGAEQFLKIHRPDPARMAAVRQVAGALD